jgi:hypothetical protein
VRQKLSFDEFRHANAREIKPAQSIPPKIILVIFLTPTVLQNSRAQAQLQTEHVD